MTNKQELSFETTYHKAVQGLRSRGMRIIIIENTAATFNGDLDGATVYLGQSQTWETKLFSLIHLATHNYQWTVNGRYAEIGSQLFYLPDSELATELLDYETKAAQIAISLLHELEIYHLDKWYSQYSYCDLAFLEDYYRMGKAKPIEEYWDENAPVFKALPLPKVTQFRQRVRVQKGVVLY